MDDPGCSSGSSRGLSAGGDAFADVSSDVEGSTDWSGDCAGADPSGRKSGFAGSGCSFCYGVSFRQRGLDLKTGAIPRAMSSD